jgi:ATP-dependent DNA ligase
VDRHSNPDAGSHSGDRLRLHLCAFDLVELDGRDLSLKPLKERKRLLAKLLHKPRAGLLLNAQFEDDGPTSRPAPPDFSS